MLRRVALFWVVLGFMVSPAVVFGDAHNPQRIMPAEVMAKLDAGETIVFLDTRTTGEWAAGTQMIANALRVKNNQVLSQIVRTLPQGRLIVTYCT